MSYEHSIGTSLGTLTRLNLLTVPVLFPRSRYREYAAQKVAASGQTIGLGDPETDWEWTVLSMAMRNQLRVFCPGASANLVVRTLKNNGYYANFNTIMHWPVDEQRSSILTLGLVVTFTHLSEITA